MRTTTTRGVTLACVLALAFVGVATAVFRKSSPPPVPVEFFAAPDHVNITGSGVTVKVGLDTFGMIVYNDSTGDIIVESDLETDNTLAYTTWVGIDLDVYEGYLWRVDVQVEEAYATNVVNYGTFEGGAWFLVDTTGADLVHKQINITFDSFANGQFKAHAYVLDSPDDHSSTSQSPAPACTRLIEDNGNTVYQKIIDSLNALTICTDLNHCSSSDNSSCEACVELVDDAIAYLHANTTEEDILSSAQSFCDSWGAERIRWGMKAVDNMDFFGFGERFNSVNQKGNKLYCWCEDGGWGFTFFPDERLPSFNPTSTYSPVPLLITTTGYGLFLNTTWRSDWDLAHTDPDAYTFFVETTEMEMWFMIGQPADIVSMYSMQLGRSLVPPDFVFGPWTMFGLIAEDFNVTTHVENIQAFLANDIPASVDTGSALHFLPDGAQRNHTAFYLEQTTNVSMYGIPSIGYFNSMIDVLYSPVFEEAVDHDYLVELDNSTYEFAYKGAGPIPFHVGVMDFTAENATTFYQDLLQEALDLGFSGFMYDYGEYIDPAAEFANGKRGVQMHNDYPLIYQAAAHEFFLSKDPDPNDDFAPEYSFHCRSAYAGSPDHIWAAWQGDPMCSWSPDSGLPSQVSAGISSNLVGNTFIGTDISGFVWLEPPTLEMWARWTQFGMMQGIMRSQDGGTPFIGIPRTHIFQWPEGLRIWRKCTKLRMALFWYLKTMAVDYRSTGMPVMRHHIIDFPNDPTAVAQDYQYMFGPNFLHAPVIAQSTYTWDVYLPEGPEWYDFGASSVYDEDTGRYRIGSSQAYTGGQTVTVNAPTDTTPIFVVAGTIIPTTDPSMFALSNATLPEIVTLRNISSWVNLWVWPDAAGNAEGHNWDGATYSTSMTTTKKSVVYTLDSTDPLMRTQIIQLAVSVPTSAVDSLAVTSDGNTFPMVGNWTKLSAPTDGVDNGYYYDDTQGVVWMRVNGTSSTTTSVQVSFDDTSDRLKPIRVW